MSHDVCNLASDYYVTLLVIRENAFDTYIPQSWVVMNCVHVLRALRDGFFIFTLNQNVHSYNRESRAYSLQKKRAYNQASGQIQTWPKMVKSSVCIV